jgi:signal transduction histidine kinase/phage shock protein PspC (stress-responsive transcriptional regulator)
MTAVCATAHSAGIGIVPDPIPDGSAAHWRDHRLVRRTVKPLSRSEFVRPVEGRMVAGVAAGLADTFGLDPNVVRCGFVVLTVASGLGLVLYLVGWGFMRDAPAEAPTRERRPFDATANVAFGAVVLGLALLVRATGIWPGDVVVWPIAAVMVGLALLALRTSSAADDNEPPAWRWLERLPPSAADAIGVLVGSRRGAVARFVAGICFVLIGIAAFFVSAHSWSAFRGAVIGGIAVLGGLLLIIGPGVSRLVGAFVQERGERIRADERAEVAAHLHDSVLQTLALVQRRADDPREVVRLARMQERELRSWLMTGAAPEESTRQASLGVALEDLAATVEVDHGVPVDVVRVRDCSVEGMEPLLLAAREAMVNAAKHSGATTISVYLEVENERVAVFVRDRGRGFDASSVGDDRQGIANSIVGRMERAGGHASVRSTRDEGTEVELTLTRPKREKQ